jgi:ribose 5-phosphate isomerase B
MTVRIALGCDPNATDLKNLLKEFIPTLGHEVTDFGSDDPLYANVAVAVASAVVAGQHDRGVLVCGSGIGVCIAANKVKGAYAANITNIYQAQRATQSNNANIVTFGSLVQGPELIKALLAEYLRYSWDPDSRSGPKVARIAEYEQGQA